MDAERLKFEFEESRVKANKSRQMVSMLPFYWYSHISEDEAEALLSEGECIVIDAEPKIRSNGTEALRYMFIWKKETTSKAVVKCAANTLSIVSTNIKLDKFTTKNKLQGLAFTRKWSFPEGLPRAVTTQMNFDEIFEMGTVTRRKLKAVDAKEVGVLAITAEFTADEKEVVVADLSWAKNVSHRNLLNIWGCHVSNADFSLLVDNTAIERFQDYLWTRDRNWGRLLSFARQLCSALVYLEELKFVHKKLTLNSCLIAKNDILKLAVFGLSTGLVPKRIYNNSIEQCRWFPPECLGKDGVEYNQKSIVWTFGTIVWSIYHAGAIPFDSELAENVCNREYRSQVQLPRYEEFFPETIARACDLCWQNMENRPEISVLQTLLR